MGSLRFLIGGIFLEFENQRHLNKASVYFLQCIQVAETKFFWLGLDMTAQWPPNMPCNNVQLFFIPFTLCSDSSRM